MKKLNTVISSRINRSIVLTEIYRNPNISRVQLADRTGLDRSAITQILNYLIEEDLVEEVEKGKPGSKGGRCPIYLQVRADTHYVAAIEVGLEHAEGLITDLKGREVFRHRIAIQRNDALMDILTGVLDEMSRRVPEPFRKAAVIGICAPGVIDPNEGVVRANMYHNWREVQVEEALSELYRKSVFVENDANVGAMGELFRLGQSTEVRSLVYLFIRDSEGEAPLGVGGALVLNDRVWHGAHHFAGESSATINSTFQRAISSHGLKAKGKGSAHRKNLQALSEAAAAGDKDAREAQEEIATRLGVLLSDLALFIDPDAVMVSLSPFENTQGLWTLIRQAYEHQQSPNERKIPFLVPGSRERAPLEGLIALGLDRIFVNDSSETSVLFPAT